jgi:Domain of unknown function (DUF4386)
MNQIDTTIAPPRPDTGTQIRVPHSRTAVVVSALFIVQLLSFAAGSSLVERYLRGEAPRQTLTIGVMLEMCSGIAVVGIGLLMYPVLKGVDRKWAIGYPIARLVEFGVSAVLGTYLLIQLAEIPNHLLWVYLPTALGGLILNYLFFVSGLVPRAIAVVGLLGYSLLLLTVPLDLLSVIDVEKGAGLVLLAPGGVYEFLVLPAWLISRGFRSAGTA